MPRESADIGRVASKHFVRLTNTASGGNNDVNRRDGAPPEAATGKRERARTAAAAAVVVVRDEDDEDMNHAAAQQQQQQQPQNNDNEVEEMETQEGEGAPPFDVPLRDCLDDDDFRLFFRGGEHARNEQKALIIAEVEAEAAIGVVKNRGPGYDITSIAVGGLTGEGRWKAAVR